MRELLFRGKHLMDGEWIFSDSVNFSRTKKYVDLYLGEPYWGWEPIFPNTVGQWIGLLDSKGNKIFDGDIVKRIVANENGLVVWDDKRCGFYIKPLSKIGRAMYDPYYKMNANKLEIVGNIYDNPELLEGN